MADGSITITADMETKKAEKELNDLQKEINQLTMEQTAAQKQLSAATAKTLKAKETLLKKEEALAQTENQAASMQEAQEPLIQKAENLRARMREAADEVERYKQQWISGVSGADREEMAARERLSEIKTEYEAILQKIEREDAAIARVNEKAQQQAQAVQAARAELEQASLAEDTARQHAEGVASALETAQAKAVELADGLSSSSDSAKDLGEAGRDAGRKIADALEKAQSSMQKFEKRIMGLAKRVFVFSLVTKALRLLRDYISDSVQASEAAQASIARLRGALATLAQPIMEKLMPAITWLINLLTRLAATAARIISRLFGTTVEESAKKAEAAQRAAEAAAKKTTKSVNKESKALTNTAKATKEAEKQLAGFDELNILTADDVEDTSDALGDLALDDFGEETEPSKYDFSSVSNGLSSVAELFVGLGLVALGAILTFTGVNIPLGLGMMVIGGLMVWDAMSGEDGNKIAQALQGPLGIIVGIVSAAIFILGVVLLFLGGPAALPIAIGMIVLGAAGMAIDAAANWDWLKEKLQGPIGKIVKLVSKALLALGIILLATGVAAPLGIALIAAGAIGLVAYAAANWDFLVEKIKQIIDKIKEKITNAVEWLKNTFDKIKEGAKAVFESIVSILRGVWNSMLNIIETGINWVIDKINFLLSGINAAANAIGGLFGLDGEVNLAIPRVSIPRLAAGAVIPPNRQFLAVLGDQKSGTNVEAPLDTIKQALMEAMAESGGGDLNLTIQIGEERFIETIVRGINRRNRASGQDLIRV